MSEDDRIIPRLMDALVQEWTTLYEVEEIACDEAKLALMISVIPEIETPSDRVRILYEKVFLRDVWNREERD